MKIIPTTEVRKRISDLVDTVRETGAAVVIGRHEVPEAVLIKFPTAYRKTVSDSTNVNVYGQSFDFLADEPDVYSTDDIRS
jgi:antitoxin (DNA-binding transcriptional repressor) of toxin-antitoxin stability system